MPAREPTIISPTLSNSFHVGRLFSTPGEKSCVSGVRVFGVRVLRAKIVIRPLAESEAGATSWDRSDYARPLPE